MPVLTDDDDSESSESERGGTPAVKAAIAESGGSSAGSSSDGEGSASGVAAWHLRGNRSPQKLAAPAAAAVSPKHGQRHAAVTAPRLVLGPDDAGNSDGSSSSSSSSNSSRAGVAAVHQPAAPRNVKGKSAAVGALAFRAGDRVGKDAASPKSMTSGGSSTPKGGFLKKGKGLVSPSSMTSGASSPKSGGLLRSSPSSPKSPKGGMVRAKVREMNTKAVAGKKRGDSGTPEKENLENGGGQRPSSKTKGEDAEEKVRQEAAAEEILRRRDREREEEALCKQQREAEELEQQRAREEAAEVAKQRARAEEEEEWRQRRIREGEDQVKEERRRADLAAAESRRKDIDELECKRREIEADEMKAEEERQEVRKREEAFWAAMSHEEAERMRGMLQAYTLYQQQLHETENGIEALRKQIANKTKACQSMRQRAHQASQDTKRSRERETVQNQEIVRWEKKRLQFSEEGQPVETLRTSHGVLESEVARMQEEARPILAQRQDLRERLAACEKSSRERARQLTDLRPQCQKEAAELRAEQLSELANLRAQQTESISRLDTQWQEQLGDLKNMYTEESSTLKASLEEASRRRDRLRQERHESSEQLCARQREGARLQQQCADARQEVVELQTQVRTAPSMASTFASRHSGMVTSLSTSSLLDASMSSSWHGASRHPRAVDFELGDLGNRCRSLERECAQMHSALEKGHEIHAKWRRRGLGRTVPRPESKRIGSFGPFALGPPEERPALSDVPTVVEQPMVGGRADSVPGSRPSSP